MPIRPSFNNIYVINGILYLSLIDIDIEMLNCNLSTY